MTRKVKPIPDEYRGATPYLCVKDGNAPSSSTRRRSAREK